MAVYQITRNICTYTSSLKFHLGEAFSTILLESVRKCYVWSPGGFQHRMNRTDFVSSVPIQLCNIKGTHHDDFIKWKHFRVTGHLCGEFTGQRWIHLTKASDAELSLIWAWMNAWVNNREAGDLRRHRAHYGVTVMVVIALFNPI